MYHKVSLLNVFFTWTFLSAVLWNGGHQILALRFCVFKYLKCVTSPHDLTVNRDRSPSLSESVWKITSEPPLVPYMPSKSTREEFNSFAGVVHTCSHPRLNKVTHPHCWSLEQKISLPAQWKVSKEGEEMDGHISLTVNSCRMQVKLPAMMEARQRKKAQTFPDLIGDHFF